jgi:hypothetical protein
LWRTSQHSCMCCVPFFIRMRLRLAVWISASGSAVFFQCVCTRASL